MTPVEQEFLHEPEKNQHGDCMRACIASLLDLPRSEVPNFAQVEVDNGINFWFMITEFCRKHRYSFVIFQGHFLWSEDPIYHIISGESPRNKKGHHAVIGRNGQVFFDPHPSKAGLAGDPNKWKFYLLVKSHKE